MRHPYHLVDISPWPILKGFGLLSGALTQVKWLTLGEKSGPLVIIVQTNVVLVLVLWLRDVIREGKAGYHTTYVKKGIIIGFNLFLVSEVKIFFSIFWTYLHSSLNPSVEIVYWPPLGVNSVDYQSLPLQNSVLLLGGGFIASGAHADLFKGEKGNCLKGLLGCLLLTKIFLYVQYVEYSFAEFTISDSIYGSSFFIGTGTHGFHILCSILLKGVAIYRIYKDSVTSEHSLVLDFALIYYHLVDIVWLLLYVIFYFWGS